MQCRALLLVLHTADTNSLTQIFFFPSNFTLGDTMFFSQAE